MRNRPLNFAFGALLSAAVLAPFTWWESVFGVKPYTAVRVAQVETLEGWTHITATFTKNDNCKLLEFKVVGHSLGLTEFLYWEDSDGLGRSYDRMAGRQTLHIKVEAGDVDTVELRTRHNCEGDIIDRTFAMIDPTETIEVSR